MLQAHSKAPMDRHATLSDWGLVAGGGWGWQEGGVGTGTWKCSMGDQECLVFSLNAFDVYGFCWFLRDLTIIWLIFYCLSYMSFNFGEDLSISACFQ